MARGGVDKEGERLEMLRGKLARGEEWEEEDALCK